MSAMPVKPLELLLPGDVCGVHPVTGTGYTVDCRGPCGHPVAFYCDGVLDTETQRAANERFYGRALSAELPSELAAFLVERWNARALVLP